MRVPFRASKTRIVLAVLVKSFFWVVLVGSFTHTKGKVCWEVTRSRGDLSLNEGREEGMTRKKKGHNLKVAAAFLSS